MKKITKILASSFVILAFATSTFAQPGVSATATATATIITPIAIANTVNMNFGNVAVNATPGTVIMTPAGGRSVTGGCTLPAVTGTVSGASFTVTGLAGATYSITLPSTAATITWGGNTMTVGTFTSDPTPTGTLTGGTEALTVGATLNVNGSQTPGTYTSLAGDEFTVTVNYN